MFLTTLGTDSGGWCIKCVCAKKSNFLYTYANSYKSNITKSRQKLRASNYLTELDRGKSGVEYGVTFIVREES